MIEKICETCLAHFQVQPYRSKSARFCSRSCRAKWVATLPQSVNAPGRHRPYLIGNKFRLNLTPTNAFQIGHKTWNKGVKGIHLSPQSEFKPGFRPPRMVSVGTESIRRTHDGNLRVFVKIADPNIWKLRAVKNWEDVNGKVPKGKVIHHKDRNTLNDDTSNLACLTRAEHALEHKYDLKEARWGSPGESHEGASP